MTMTKQAFRAQYGAARAALNRGEITNEGHLECASEFDEDGAVLVSRWTGLPVYAPWGLSGYQVARAARRVAEDSHDSMRRGRAEAAARIAAGEDPDLMVHFIDDNPYRGLSSGLTPEEHQRGGYTSRYYRLGDLAGA